MGIGINIITTDENVDQARASIKARCDTLEESIGAYIKLLENLCTAGFASGQTSEAIRAFADVAKELKGQFESIGQSIDITLENFNEEIDSADEYLY